MQRLTELSEPTTPLSKAEKVSLTIAVTLGKIMKDIDNFSDRSILTSVIESELRHLYAEADFWGFMEGGRTGIIAAMDNAEKTVDV